MRKLKSETVRSMFLMIEAALVMIAVITGSTSTVGFICYWGLVAFYHLMDFLFGAIADYLTEEKDDGERND